MINRTQIHKPVRLCKDCLCAEKGESDVLNSFTKEDWICVARKIIDLLDGGVTYHPCRKSRKDEKLCGADGQWYKAKP
jgi:hypothetical protein